MFICRACRGAQKRLFSSTKIFSAETPSAPPRPQLQEALERFRQASPTDSRRPSSGSGSGLDKQIGFEDQPAKGVTTMDNFMGPSAARRRAPKDFATQAEQLAAAQAKQDRLDMERQMTRRWQEGDVYSPHDLSGTEQSKWKVPRTVSQIRKSRDICDVLNINPLHHYKNFSLMSEFVTEMGRIKGRSETGLRPINQRRMAKAIRRAVGLGLMPSVHKHPEILRIQMEKKNSAASRRRFG